MENVERILKQSDQTQRSFPVEEHRWQRLEASLRARKKRRQMGYWLRRSLPLLLLLILFFGLRTYYPSSTASIIRESSAKKERRMDSPRTPLPAESIIKNGRAGLPDTSIQNPTFEGGQDFQEPALSPDIAPSLQSRRVVATKKTPPSSLPETPLPKAPKNTSLTNPSAKEIPIPTSEDSPSDFPAFSHIPVAPKLLNNLPVPLDPLEIATPGRTKWTFSFTTGLLKGQALLAPARFSEEQKYSGQLVTETVNGIKLYQWGEQSRTYTDYGRTLALQLQRHLSNRISLAFGLTRWQFQYESLPQEKEGQASEFYFQHISIKQTHWLSEIGLQYQLLGMGRWQFQIGSSTLLSLSNKSRSHLSYRQHQQWIGEETLIQNTPWEHSLRSRIGGQISYRFHQNWQIGLGSGCLINKPLLPYFTLGMQVRL